MKRSLYLIGSVFVCCAMSALADDFPHHARHRPVRVFDANGHVIGDLTIFAAQNGVALTVGNATSVVPITRVQDASFHFSSTDFRWIATLYANYTSTDCTGNPIVDSATGPRTALAVRRGNDVTVYFAAEGTEQSYTARSALDPSSASGCRAIPGPFATPGFPVGASLAISREHPEPLRIGY